MPTPSQHDNAKKNQQKMEQNSEKNRKQENHYDHT